MSRELNTVGVVGLGTMGAGIVEVFARTGLDVVAVEVDDEALERGRGHLLHSTGRAVARGKLTEEQQAELIGRITFATQLDAFAGCDLVVEAVPEHLDLKKEIFGKLDSIVRPDAILATNTSSLSVTEISVATHNPRRVVGMHFFNPAPVLHLVEVVRTALASDEAYETAFAFAERLGKQPIRCGDTPGFVVNRILIPLLNDCVRVLDEAGVTAEDLDKAMRFGANWPIGPCALVDLIGVDVHVHASEAIWEAVREPRFAPPPRLVRMAQAGHLGRKTGRGFFEYGDS
jgi:3-hydroxybutyryl-CoA dehydrogenase